MDAPSGFRVLVLQPAEAELARVAPWLEESGKALGIDPGTSFKLDLCIEEWVANLLRHAHVDAPVTLELARTGGETILTILDSGVPFDPTVLAAPERAASLDEARIGGQGVHLMKSFSTGWSYAASGPRGNALTLRFASEPS